MTAHIRQMTAALLALTFVLWAFPSFVHSAEEESPVDEMKSIQQARMTYEYKSADARDPFASLIMDVSENTGEMGKDPVQMYDIELIRLVAVVTGDDSGYGLVRLPDGKHYTVRVGTSIGIHEGKVVDIQPSKVIIKQMIMNFRRELVEQSRELKLREEDDK